MLRKGSSTSKLFQLFYQPQFFVFHGECVLCCNPETHNRKSWTPPARRHALRFPCRTASPRGAIARTDGRTDVAGGFELLSPRESPNTASPLAIPWCPTPGSGTLLVDFPPFQLTVCVWRAAWFYRPTFSNTTVRLVVRDCLH
jgi:hypothetical protein